MQSLYILIFEYTKQIVYVLYINYGTIFFLLIKNIDRCCENYLLINICSKLVQ